MVRAHTVTRMATIVLMDELATVAPRTRVRLVARLVSYSHMEAIVAEPDETLPALVLRVDTCMLAEARLGALGSLVNLLGELDVDRHGLVLRASIAHVVDELNVVLWRRALLLRRGFLLDAAKGQAQRDTHQDA